MDSIHACETNPGSSVVECPTILITDEDAIRIQPDEDAMRIQPDEASNQIKTKKSLRSDGGNTKQPAKDGKLLMKRKKPTRPPTSQMVMEAIKALKKRNGASVEAILEYIVGHYEVNTKLIKGCVTRYLQSAVKKVAIEQLCGAGNEGRYKIKKAEKVSKVGQKLKDNQKKNKAVKK